MNSKELWNLLESNNNEDIQSMVTMCIVYLIKKRNLRLKGILKGIKNCIKSMGGVNDVYRCI